jgi:hypothetical protein
VPNCSPLTLPLLWSVLRLASPYEVLMKLFPYEFIDTSSEKLYTVPLSSSVVRRQCSRILDQAQSQRKGEFKMGGDILKGGEPPAKKKAKKKAAAKKAAPKKAAKKKAAKK